MGGGIAGLTLALCLQRAGHNALVTERSPRLRDAGYMIDFFGPGYDASEKMGILSEIAAIHYQIPRLAFLGSSGAEKFSLSYATLRKNLFGDRHFNFMRGDLEQLLYSKIEDRMEVRLGTSVDAFEQDEAGVRVKLTDGTTGSFDLLVGADGVYFDEVAQIEMPRWRQGRVVFVGDACGCVSLLAGQGVSMAVSGACTLAEKLSAAQEGEIAPALARYEGKLKPMVEKRQKSGRRLARWFVPDNRARLLTRDAVMRMTASSLASLVLRRRFA